MRAGAIIGSMKAHILFWARDIGSLLHQAGGKLRTMTWRPGVSSGAPAATVHGELQRLAAWYVDCASGSDQGELRQRSLEGEISGNSLIRQSSTEHQVIAHLLQCPDELA